MTERDYIAGIDFRKTEPWSVGFSSNVDRLWIQGVISKGCLAAQRAERFCRHIHCSP